MSNSAVINQPIGEISAKSGLPVKTIRYYEEIGLLAPTVGRSKAGYRLFNPSVFNRLAFIKRAQSLGLSLSEIQQILEVHDRGELPCGEVRSHLETKVAAVSEQIAALETLRSELRGILSGWQDQPSEAIPQGLRRNIGRTICPNLQPE